LLLLSQPRPLVTCRRLSRPALSGPVTGGNENSDLVVFSSFPVLAVVAREFLSRQIESWRCFWRDGVMEPDARVAIGARGPLLVPNSDLGPCRRVRRTSTSWRRVEASERNAITEEI
jgi:hypothetical protein